ncbi:MAG: T9SS type A sorting domain-containing protein [Chitinophagales bacterium]|nr:T9SS type A sorting domain-containing protein [Chitinophagales bacterium]
MNAVYKFPSVAPGVDAYITILNKVGGATLTNIDDNVYGYSAAWQPVVKTKTAPGSGESYISFRIQYKNSVDSSSHTFNCFQLSFIDVDGDNDKVQEFVAAKDFASYTVSNNSVLTMSTQAGMTKALGPVTNWNNIDTSSYPTNINFRYANTDKVNEVWIGSKVSNGFTVQDRYNCSYFANVSIPNGGILPVTYTSFDAVVADKTVLLKWITAREMNNSHFVVERSFDKADFSTAGIVLDGFSVNGTGKSYQFKDNIADLQGKTVVYYRLKQVDVDGKFTYSNVLAVRLQSKTGVTMQVSPNPFTENLSMRFSATENGTAQIRIINSYGQTLLSKQSSITKGFNNLQVEGLSQLAPGMYIAQLVMNGAVIDNQRVIKN